MGIANEAKVPRVRVTKKKYKNMSSFLPQKYSSMFVLAAMVLTFVPATASATALSNAGTMFSTTSAGAFSGQGFQFEPAFTHTGNDNAISITLPNGFGVDGNPGPSDFYLGIASNDICSGSPSFTDQTFATLGEGTNYPTSTDWAINGGPGSNPGEIAITFTAPTNGVTFTAGGCIQIGFGSSAGGADFVTNPAVTGEHTISFGTHDNTNGDATGAAVVTITSGLTNSSVSLSTTSTGVLSGQTFSFEPKFTNMGSDNTISVAFPGGFTFGTPSGPGDVALRIASDAACSGSPTFSSQTLNNGSPTSTDWGFGYSSQNGVTVVTFTAPTNGATLTAGGCVGFGFGSSVGGTNWITNPASSGLQTFAITTYDSTNKYSAGADSVTLSGLGHLSATLSDYTASTLSGQGVQFEPAYLNTGTDNTISVTLNEFSFGTPSSISDIALWIGNAACASSPFLSLQSLAFDSPDSSHWGISVTNGNTMTFTAPTDGSAALVAGNCIQVGFGSYATGSNWITNPSSSGSHTVTVTTHDNTHGDVSDSTSVTITGGGGGGSTPNSNAIINYQGRLMDLSGNLQGSSGGSNFCFRFSFFDARTSGNQIWPESSATPHGMTVSVISGVFNAAIGDDQTTSGEGDSLSTFDFNAHTKVYLKVEVATQNSSSCNNGNSWDTLSPNQQIGTAPFARVAASANTLGGLTAAVGATGSQIPALSSGNLTLGAANPQINAGSGDLVLQGGGGTVAVGGSTGQGVLKVNSTTTTSDVTLFRVSSSVGGSSNPRFDVTSDGNVAAAGGTTLFKSLPTELNTTSVDTNSDTVPDLTNINTGATLSLQGDPSSGGRIALEPGVSATNTGRYITMFEGTNAELDISGRDMNSDSVADFADITTTNGPLSLQGGGSQNIYLFGGSANMATFSGTDGSATFSGTVHGSNVDLAENYPVADQSVGAGDILSLTNTTRQICKKGNIDCENVAVLDRSQSTYDTKLFGVISTKPGFSLGTSYDYTRPIALAGRVPVKISSENGPIAIGDPITASSTPGVGMKATHSGYVIGTALEAYNGQGQGTTLIFVHPRYWFGGADGNGEVAGAASVDTTIFGDYVAMPLDALMSKEFGIISTVGQQVAKLSTAVVDTFKAKVAIVEQLYASVFTVVPDGEVRLPVGDNQLAGSGKILSGSSTVVIMNIHVTPDTKIILTPTALIDIPLVVTQKDTGVSFTVSIARNATQDITFDWILFSGYATKDEILKRQQEAGVISPVAPVVENPAPVVDPVIAPPVVPAAESVTPPAAEPVAPPEAPAAIVTPPVVENPAPVVDPVIAPPVVPAAESVTPPAAEPVAPPEAPAA